MICQQGRDRSQLLGKGESFPMPWGGKFDQYIPRWHPYSPTPVTTPLT